MTNSELEIKKICFKAHGQLNLFQESHFIYNRSNIVKQSFVNEINKFLPIYCSASYFDEKTKEKISILSAKSSKGYFIEKTSNKREINLQMVKISSKQAETLNKKIIPNNNIGCRQKNKKRNGSCRLLNNNRTAGL